MLRERFKEEIVPRLMEELELGNVMRVPRVGKVVVNMGILAKDNPKVLEGAVSNLTKITGQKPVVTKAQQ